MFSITYSDICSLRRSHCRRFCSWSKHQKSTLIEDLVVADGAVDHDSPILPLATVVQVQSPAGWQQVMIGETKRSRSARSPKDSSKAGCGLSAHSHREIYFPPTIVDPRGLGRQPKQTETGPAQGPGREKMALSVGRLVTDRYPQGRRPLRSITQTSAAPFHWASKSGRSHEACEPFKR